MEQATTKLVSGTVGFNRRLKGLFAARETGILLALLIICTLLTLTTSNFLTVQNLLNVGRQVSLQHRDPGLQAITVNGAQAAITVQ